MDVGAARDRSAIAQQVGRSVANRLDAWGFIRRYQPFERQHAGRPGPEMLRGEIVAHAFAYIAVDVARRHRVAAAILDILEQMLARQVAQPTHDRSQVPVGQSHFALLARLGAKEKAQRLTLHLRMTLAERGCAITAILPDVAFISHAERGKVEQANDRGGHLARAKPAIVKIAQHRAAKRRKRFAELLALRKFALFILRDESRMIAILAPAFLVGSKGKDMAIAPRAETAGF